MNMLIDVSYGDFIDIPDFDMTKFLYAFVMKPIHPKKNIKHA